jgi:hypothetical protein
LGSPRSLGREPGHLESGSGYDNLHPACRLLIHAGAGSPAPPVIPRCEHHDEAELDTLRYSRIAIIEATGSGEWTNQTDMLDAMRKKAGAIGANAILLPQINEPGAGAKVAAAIFGTGTQRKGNVVALRILGRKEPSDSTTAAGPRSTASPAQRARPSFRPARPSALSGRPHSRTTR